jgi:hypothetical protein
MTGDKGKFMVKCSLILLSFVFLIGAAGNNAMYKIPGKKAGKESNAKMNKESGIKAGKKAGVKAKKEFCDAVNSKFIKFRWETLGDFQLFFRRKSDCISGIRL